MNQTQQTYRNSGNVYSFTTFVPNGDGTFARYHHERLPFDKSDAHCNEPFMPPNRYREWINANARGLRLPAF